MSSEHQTLEEVQQRLAAAEAVIVRMQTSEARYRLLIESWTQAVWETDAAGVVVVDSPSWRAYTGQTLEQWLGYGWLDAIHPADRSYAERQWRDAIAVRGLVNAEFRLRAPDGGWRWTNARAAPMLDAGGNILKWVGINVDITARKHAEAALRESEERQPFLLKLGDAFRPLNDVAAIAETACRMVVEELDASRAQFTAVEGVPGEEIGEVRGEYVRTGVPMPRRFAFATYGEQLVSSLRDGKTLILTDTDSDPRITDELRQAFRAVDSPAAIAVPLVKSGLLITTLTAHNSVKRGWTSREVAIVQETAERTWAAIERAQALAALTASETALRESEEQQAFLLKLSDALRPLADPTEVMTVASESLGRQLGVGRCGYGEMDATDAWFVVERDWTDGVMPSAAGRHLVSDFGKDLMAAHRAGAPLAIDDAFDAARRDDLVAYAAAGGLRAILASPLVKEGRMVASLFAQDTAPRRWTEAEIALVKEVAERTWAAVERARAETALRESEERQRLTIELVPALLWSAGPDEHEVNLNESWLAYTGQTEADTQDNGWLDAIHPDDLPATRIAFERAIATGEPLERQHRIYKAGHGYRWHLVRQVPVLNEHGEITRWFGAAVDIHEGKLAEIALYESEERFQRFAEASSDVLWVRDAQSHAATFVSAAAATVYGAAPKTLIEDPLFWDSLIVPEDRREMIKQLEDVRRGGASVVDLRVLRPSDNVFRWIRRTAFPLLGAEGHVVAVAGMSSDITEQRLLTEHQSVLLAELQHRVRNIMAMIRSMALRTSDGAKDVGDYRSLLEGRLMALARVQVLLTRAANAGGTLRDIIENEVSVQASYPGQFELDGPNVRLSPKAVEVLTLVFHELATNSLKYGAFSAPNGRLRVVWSTFQKRDRTWLALNWTETGAPPRAPVTRRGFGSDLIEGRIPYELGGSGKVVIASTGARCRLEFPLKDGESILETDAPTSAVVFGGTLDMKDAPDLTGRRVLVVEDDYYIAGDTAAALRGAGATVLGPCPTENATRDLLERELPTHAVVDLNLGGGGPRFEIAHLLRERGVPFVFLTGYDPDVIPADFVDVVRMQKPVPFRNIVEAVGQL